MQPRRREEAPGDRAADSLTAVRRQRLVAPPEPSAVARAGPEQPVSSAAASGDDPLARSRVLVETVRVERARLAAGIDQLERRRAAVESGIGRAADLLGQARRLLTKRCAAADGAAQPETAVGAEFAAGALARETVALRQRLADAEAAVVRARAEAAEKSDPLERAVTAGRQREAALQRTVDQLRHSIEDGKLAVLKARADTGRREQERQALEVEVGRMRARAIELQQRLQAEAQQHLGQAAKSAERVEAEAKQRARVQEEVDRLREEIAQLREDLAQAVGAKSALEREVRDVRRQLETEQHKGELARLHAKLEEIAWTHPAAVRGASGEAADACAAGGGAAEPAPPENMPIIAIGASTGGPAALGEILPLLPAEFPACLLVVQHMPPGYTADLATNLDQRTAITVREARHGDRLRPGIAFIAPGGHHMEVRDGTIKLSAGPPVNNVRPSVDVLFDSLVDMARRVQAVLLTGMGSDGASGMSRLRASGGETIVQDQSSSVVWGMPGAAVKAGAAVLQMPPAKLGHYLVRRIASLQSGASRARASRAPAEQAAAS